MSLYENFTTEDPNITEKPYVNDDSKYLIVPLLVIVIVMVLSVCVYLMAKRRRMDNFRHRLLSLYDIEDSTNMEDEWEHLNNYEYKSYSSRDYTTSTVF